MLPSSHHGHWAGPNRLWLDHLAPPRVSEGTLEVTANRVAYTWVFEGAPHRGVLELSGPSGSFAASWNDSWHAAKGQQLHGCFSGGVVRLWGSYGAGEGPDWGWRIELDTRDPESVELWMFNVPPDPGTSPYAGPETIAVHLQGARVITT
jgi:hypothetical protein